MTCSLGTNEFGQSRGYQEVEIPCFKYSVNYTWGDELTGEDGNCICGGTKLPEESDMTDLMCSTETYYDNCCPDDPNQCGGRPDSTEWAVHTATPTQAPDDEDTDTPEPTVAPTTPPHSTPEPTQAPDDEDTDTPEPTVAPTTPPHSTPEPTQAPDDEDSYTSEPNKNTRGGVGPLGQEAGSRIGSV